MSGDTERAELPRWRTFWFLLGIGGLVAILWLAISPLPRIMPPVTWSDKVLHLVVFCGLMVWFAALFPRRHYLAVLIALLLYGLLMEFLQSMVPDRAAEFADVVADIAGLLLGWVLARTGLARWPHWFERLVPRR